MELGKLMQTALEITSKTFRYFSDVIGIIARSDSDIDLLDSDGEDKSNEEDEYNDEDEDNEDEYHEDSEYDEDDEYDENNSEDDENDESCVENDILENNYTYNYNTNNGLYNTRDDIRDETTSTKNIYYSEERSKEHISKSINAFFVVLIIIVIAIAGCIVLVSHIEDSKMIEIGVSPDKLLGMKYETVESILKDNGFTNIELRERNDIDIKDTSDLSKVINVSIRGKSEFNETDLVPYDSRIVVVYHNVKKMAIPLSHEEAKKKNADDLLNILHNSGFVNIEMVAEYDLLLGWFNKDRSVISVTIDGNAEFSETEEFYQNAPIVIKYHTFIKDKK